MKKWEKRGEKNRKCGWKDDGEGWGGVSDKDYRNSLDIKLLWEFI